MASNEEKRKAKTENQKKVFDFFTEHFRSQKPFTKKEVEAVTSWQRRSFPTHWSKQFKQFVVAMSVALLELSSGNIVS